MHRLPGSLTVVLGIVLATSSVGSPALAVRQSGVAQVSSASRSLSDPGSTAARAALARVRSLFSAPAPGDGPGKGPVTISGATGATGTTAGSASDATLALRDLARLRDRLPPAQQAEAARILARPTDGASDPQGNGYDTAEAPPVCSSVVCVHYVSKPGDKDAVAAADADGNGVPDFVDAALATFSHVDSTYVAAGYLAPESDGTRGGNALPDVYLADVGDQGLYGYCTSDQRGSPRTTWAYCVVDNNFAHRKFPHHTPLQNLQVTAAHEYFHAVQFGYDYLADAWFMEATATWAEDEVYTKVNDNRQYLRSSPISDPQVSMDQFRDVYHYGVWLFFRYLTERFPTAVAGMPTLVRDLWRLDDTRGGAAGLYSMKAIAAELKALGSSIPDAFSRFVVANLMPDRSYQEGRAYRPAPLAATFRLTTGTKRYAVTLDHLASATVRYRPTARTGPRARLRLGFDLAPAATGSAALVTIQVRGKAPRVVNVPLSTAGDKRLSLQFGQGTVTWVDVSLVNAGVHYRCHQHTRFSCAGKPLDDGRTEHLSAHVTT